MHRININTGQLFWSTKPPTKSPEQPKNCIPTQQEGIKKPAANPIQHETSGGFYFLWAKAV
jgi:hypothetical protein